MKLLWKRMLSVSIAFIMISFLGQIQPHKTYAAVSTDKDQAASIEIGEEVEDSLSEKTEEDWYTFTTPTTESGVDSWFKITQIYSNKKENGYAPSVYLYDEKDKELLHVSPGREKEEESGYIILEAESTYYIMVASEYHNDTADYRFTVTELMDEAGETMEQAVDLERNMTNRFEMQSYDDEDWFFVEADTINPSLIVKNANVLSMTVEVYDIDGIKLDAFGVDRSESNTVKLKLEDKNFYVRVYSYYSTEECVGNYAITVNDKVNVTKVVLNKSKAELMKGKSLKLKATVTPSDATDKTVVWKSSNSKIATVDKNGKVVAKKAGIVTITCTAKDGSNKKATCKITVK